MPSQETTLFSISLVMYGSSALPGLQMGHSCSRVIIAALYVSGMCHPQDQWRSSPCSTNMIPHIAQHLSPSSMTIDPLPPAMVSSPYPSNTAPHVPPTTLIHFLRKHFCGCERMAGFG